MPIRCSFQKSQKRIPYELSDLTGEQLKRSLKNAYCYVALDENNKVVGTSSIKITDNRILWKKVKGCYYCMGAVIHEYQGTDIYMDLVRIRDEEVRKHNVDFLFLILQNKTS